MNITQEAEKKLPLPDVSQLAQKPPFRFVTRVTSCSNNEIDAILELTGDEWFFQGHFPQMPIFPGVLQQESLFQAASLLMQFRSTSGLSIEANGLGVVTKVEQARFKRMLAPPCTIKLQVKFVEQLQNAFFFKGNISHEDKTVCQLSFTCATLPSQGLGHV